MKVTVTSLRLTPSGLRLALVIYGPKDSWVRFASVLLPKGIFTGEILAWMLAEVDRALDTEPDSDQLEMDWT